MKTVYEAITSKTVLNRVKAPSMPFEWSINPYRGCRHGCSFCYARSTHSFLESESGDTFQHHIYLKENAPYALKEQLNRMLRDKPVRSIGRIAIGTATDPYQPVEAKARITRQCLEILAEYPIPVSITTRSPLILRDLDILRSMRAVLSVNVSIGTLDYAMCRKWEPAAPHPHRRLMTVAALREQGIRTGIFMAPILPLITDDEAELSNLIKAARDYQAAFVMASYLRLSTREVKVWFFETLQREFPGLVARYGELYKRSSTLPAEYKDRKYRQINQWLELYGLNNMETTKQEQPEQLSFSF